MSDEAWSFRVFMRVSRAATVPWPHFVLCTACAATCARLVVVGSAAWAVVAALAATGFLITGLMSVWLRRMMEGG